MKVEAAVEHNRTRSGGELVLVDPEGKWSYKVPLNQWDIDKLTPLLKEHWRITADKIEVGTITADKIRAVPVPIGGEKSTYTWPAPNAYGSERWH